MDPLEQILDEHGDAVFSFLLQLTRSEPDARDLFDRPRNANPPSTNRIA